jgi:CheY-like chemotaxis protein
MEDAIKEFLARRYSAQVQAIALKTRELLLRLLPKLIERFDILGQRISYGFTESNEDMLFIIEARKNSVLLHFRTGKQLADPNGLLKGKWKFARYVEIHQLAELEKEALTALILAQVKVNGLILSLYRVASNKSILLLEPDGKLRQIIEVSLREEGYEVLARASYEAALESSHKTLPSLILTEIDLPDKNGFELLRELRQNTRTSHVPVIIITERNSREDKIKGLELGADDYVTKPFDIDELNKRIESAVMSGCRIDDSRNIMGLPTGNLIEDYLRKIIKQSNWVYIDVKINYVDSYKEVYGWQAWDEVVKRFSNILREVWEGDFVGHPGGDNFIIITGKGDWKSYLDKLSERFDEELGKYYKEADIGQGFILVNGAKASLMSLSYGVFDSSTRVVQSIREIVELATEDRRRRMGFVDNDDEGYSEILSSW